MRRQVTTCMRVREVEAHAFGREAIERGRRGRPACNEPSASARSVSIVMRRTFWPGMARRSAVGAREADSRSQRHYRQQTADGRSSFDWLRMSGRGLPPYARGEPINH